MACAPLVLPLACHCSPALLSPCQATAWLSAVLLLAVGVSEHDVAADYLRGRGGTTASPRQPGLLQAGLAAAKAAAAGGSIEAYLGSVLGLADHDRDTLRQTLVAPP